jgi:hypothetical protein
MSITINMTMELNALDAEAMRAGLLAGLKNKAFDRSAITEKSQRAFYLAGYNIGRNEHPLKCMPESERKVIQPLLIGA